MKGNNTKIVKKANTYRLLSSVMSEEAITLEDLVKKTSLSRPTVVNIVNDLKKQGLIRNSGYAEYTGGRLPTLLSLDADSRYAIGVDFEFPPMRMTISNLRGEAVHTRACTLDAQMSKNELVQHMLDEMESLITESGIDRKKLIGVCIGILGILNTHQGISLTIRRIKDWTNVNFKQIIHERFKLPAYVINDINMMALAEKKLYLQENIGDFIYIGIRPGVRSAIGLAIHIDGSYHGINNSYEGGNTGDAYLFGHTTVEANGEVCGVCGGRGCLELVAGEKNMIDRYMELSGNAGCQTSQPVNGIGELKARADNGDVHAAEVIHAVGNYLGAAIANVLKMLGMSKVVIGGPDAALYRDVVSAYVQRNMTIIPEDVTIIEGRLQEELYPLGSCHLVIDQFLQEPRLNL